MTADTRGPQPPRLALALLERVISPADRDEIVGDLTELFADRVAAKRRANGLWFWAHTLSFTITFTVPARRMANAQSTAQAMPNRRWNAAWDRVRLSLRHSARRLRLDWRYAVGVTLILAIGFGPAAAMWSIVNRIWLQPLAYHTPERLGLIRFNLGQIANHPGLSPSEVTDLRHTSGVFAAVEAASRPTEMSLGPVEHLEPLSAINLTPGFLPMLGVTPAIGHFFTQAEADVSARLALLDYGFWRRRFNGDSSIVGQKILLNGNAVDVVGVMPRGFTLTTGRSIPQSYDVYMPMRLSDSRSFWAFPTVVRLADSVSFDKASAALATLATSLTAQYPAVYADGHLRFALAPLGDDMLRDTRPSLRAAMAGVALLLLIAIANATALVVARLKTRERDFALRTAIGASRGALVVDVLTESSLLSVSGALLGTAVAAAAVAAARAYMPHTVPRWDQVSVGWELALYTSALAFAGLFAIGVIPLWKLSPDRQWQLLRSGAMPSGRIEQAVARLALVGAQIALTVVLAFAAVQLVRSAVSLGAVNVGFDPNVLTFRVPFDRAGFTAPHSDALLYERVRDRLRQVPGVESVGAVSHLPLSGATLTDGYTADLTASSTSFNETVANYYSVSPGYFAAVRIPVVRGRDFSDIENETGQPVIVVDETLARTAFPGQEPLGRTLKLGWGIPDSRIVGVVGHVRAIEVGREVRPQIYAPYGTFQWPPLIFTVRTQGDPLQMVDAMTAAVHEVGTSRAPAGFAMLTDNVSVATSTLHSITDLVLVLALSAGLLCAIGLYSVMSYLVHQRRRATAIRSALGATRARLVREHLATSVSVIGVALPVGAALAVVIAPLFGALFYRVGPREVSSIVAAAIIAACAGLAGTFVPVRRAADTDPAVVLRGE
jgi:putative ABC transport system permease protein